jgi:hypothetical protein
MKQIVDLGSLDVTEVGKGEACKEYYINNIAGLDFSYEKISGAAICKYKDGELSYLMYGFMNGENIKDGWKKCKVVKHVDKSDKIFKKDFKKVEKDFGKGKESEKEEGFHEEHHGDFHEKDYHDKHGEHLDEHHEEHHEEYHPEKHEEHHEEHHEDKHEEYHSEKHEDKHEECHLEKHEDKYEEYHPEKHEDKHEEYHPEKHEEHHVECKDENYNINHHKEYNSKKEYDYYGDESYGVLGEKCDERIKNESKFDEYENTIENTKNQENDLYNFEPSGDIGKFFTEIVKGFEEYKSKIKDIKYCKWYKVKVNSLDDMCNITNYNKYTVAYYPMLNYYPYIKKYGYFMLGYKCDPKGNLKYIVYGVPGKKDENEQPYSGKTGFVTWMEMNDRDEGCWLMFYDFRNSTIVVPMQ